MEQILVNIYASREGSTSLGVIALHASVEYRVYNCLTNSRRIIQYDGNWNHEQTSKFTFLRYILGSYRKEQSYAQYIVHQETVWLLILLNLFSTQHIQMLCGHLILTQQIQVHSLVNSPPDAQW